MYIRIFIVACILLACRHGPALAQVPQPDLNMPHEPLAVVIRTTSPLSSPGKDALMGRLGTSFSADNVESVSPALPWVAEGLRNGRITSHPLAAVYILRLTTGSDLAATIGQLSETPGIVYAEPYYHYRPLIRPNDPEAGSQYYLELTQAFDAWDVEPGDTTITVAILDTGVDYLHEDMRENIQYNFSDPVNGTDDDGDGLIDNFFGWDIANSDNVPLPDTDVHGSQVAGVSGATVNNNIGIAGMGFRTRTLPIKIFRSGSNNFVGGYEAIALAADLGCQVINLSWGEAGAYSRFGEEVIRYAVLEKDAAVIAAAGNTNGRLDFYPASFPYVLSAGATNASDQKTTWGTYSPYIDLTAPGENIFSVARDGAYASGSGSSFSSPMVAAAVALVRSRFPELNALQAMERVRVNADDIQAAQAGNPWENFMGKGRLNMFRALTDITSPALRISNFDYSNGIGTLAYYQDTITLDLEFTNYLYPATGSRAIFSSESPYVSLPDPEVTLPALGALESNRKQVRLVLAADTPPDTRILIRVDFSAGAYKDRQYIEFTTSPSWLTLDNGQVQLTLSADGNLGYATNLKQKGVGFTRHGENILDNIGLVIRSGDIIMDNIPVRQSQHVREADFVTSTGLRPGRNSIADHYASSTFVTDPDRAARLPLQIEQKAYSLDGLGAVVVEYFITNTSDSVLQDFQPAVLADFDLADETKNRLNESGDGLFQYTSDQNETLYGGLEAAGATGTFLRGLDKRNLDGNVSDLPLYLTDEVKKSFFFLDKNTAGTEGSGNDVAGFAGLDPVSLNAGSSLRFAFILSAAESLEELQQTHARARELYQQFRENPPIGLIAGYCPGSVAEVDPPGSMTRIYQDADRTQLIFEGNRYTIPSLSGPLTLYGEDINNGVAGDLYRILVVPAGVETDFAMSRDTVFLDEENNTRVVFSDRSQEANQWTWTFGNGYTSRLRNPLIHFTEPGTYQVRLESSNALGCSGIREKTISVVRRNPRPEALTLTGCPGSSFIIDPVDTDSIHVYASPDQDQLLYQGRAFTTGAVYQDSAVYITSLDGMYESLPAEIRLDINEISATFSGVPDTTALENRYLLRLKADDEQATFLEWQVTGPGGQVSTLGNDPVLLFDYSDLSVFTIRLTAYNQEGCNRTEEITFIPSASESPDVPDDVIACAGEPGILKLADSRYYHFYADPALSQLIGKGRQLLIPEVTEDTVVYVVGMDDLLESEPVAATIRVSKIEAMIDMPASPVNLAATPVIRFTDASTGSIVSRQWLVNGTVAGNEEVFEFSPEEPGSYLLKLTVRDVNQCVSSRESRVQVIMVTSLDPEAGDDWLPYPNPARSEIILPDFAERAQLISSDGRLNRECQGCKILQLEGIVPGSFLLRITRQNKTRVFQVIVE